MSDVNVQLGNMSLQDLQAELTARGIALDKLAAGLQNPTTQNPSILKAQLINLLRHFIQEERMSVMANVPNTYKIARKQSTVQFFSEVIMTVHGDELLFCGPFFPSPRDRPVTVTIAMDLNTHVWRTITTTGKVPNPFMVFKRMPIYFINGTFLYVAYSDTDRGRYTVHYLDLKAWIWYEIEATGPAPPPRDYVDGCCHDGCLIVSGHTSNTVENSNIVHKLDLSTRVWSVVNTIGTFPATPNGSSLRIKDQLCVFSKDSDALHTLDLISFRWERIALTKLPDFNARRHSHLIQIYNEKFYLVRACDSFQLNMFDYATKEWKVIETIGKRPNKVRTEASLHLHEGTLYVLGGQAGKNHLLLLNLQDGPQPQTAKKPEWLSVLYHQEDTKDLLFEFPSGQTIGAHRLILSARSQYFKMMFASGMSESRRAIKIEDVEFQIFEAVIHYFYDQLDFDSLVQRDIDFGTFFMVADKYLLLDLQELVAAYLIKNLEPVAAITALRLFSNASPKFPQTYKKRVLDYMCLNAKEVAALPMFVEICKEDPGLVQEVFGAMASDEPLPKRMKFTQDDSEPDKTNPNTELWFPAEQS